MSIEYYYITAYRVDHLKRRSRLAKSLQLMSFKVRTKNTRELTIPTSLLMIAA